MNLDIGISELRSIIKEAVKEVLQEEKIEFFLNTIRLFPRKKYGQ